MVLACRWGMLLNNHLIPVFQGETQPMTHHHGSPESVQQKHIWDVLAGTTQKPQAPHVNALLVTC